MNKSRRKRVADIADMLSDVRDRISEILEEEEEYRDNIPENLQGSERYEKADEACDTLDTCGESLEEIVALLQELAED